MASPSANRAWLEELQRVDRALYEAVARTRTPRLDVAMPRLAQAADYSRLSIFIALLLALAGGRRSRMAAASGLVSVAATSAVANLVVKPLGRRHRPGRGDPEVPLRRRVAMPQSASFPSGHTAAAVAFAAGTGRRLPAAGPPLYALATLVGYSRIHTGVHYPGDVIGGAVLGAVMADLVDAGIPRSRQR